jgi:tetratricopeptide (TPR) repeat protein
MFDEERLLLHQQCFALLKSEWDRLAEPGQRSTTLATKLLTHAEKCAEWEHVAAVALAAAHEFWKTYNADEALEMIAHAESAQKASGAENVLDTAEARYLHGIIDEVGSRYDAAAACYRDASERFARAARPERAVDALGRLANIYLWKNEHAELFAVVERATAQSRAIAYDAGTAWLLISAGRTHLAHAAFEESMKHFQEALSMFERTNLQAGIGAALYGIGTIHRNNGRYPEALACFERALETYQALGDRRAIGQTYGSLGVLHYVRGESDLSLENFRKGIEILETMGDRMGSAMQTADMGLTYSRIGRLDEAIECLTKAHALEEAVGNRIEAGRTTGNLGSMYLERGDVSAAIDHYSRALAVAEEFEDRRQQAYWHSSLGNVNRLEKQFDEAQRHLDAASELIDAIALGELRPEHRKHQAQLAFDRGDREVALRLMREAAELYREQGNAAQCVECEEEAGRIES